MNLKARNPIKVVFLALMFVGTPVAHADNASSDAIIAIVNNDVITMKDLRQYVASVAS